MSEIDVTKYFKIHRDEYSRVFAIETVGDERELIKEIRKQNEQLHRYKQVVKDIKEIAEEQVPYINLDQVKTCTEVEYDYVGKVWNLEQRMYNILQIIDEV